MRLCNLSRKLLLLGDQPYLDPTDECYFADHYECSVYTGIKRDIISLKGRDALTIMRGAKGLSLALPTEWTRTYTFVPMPASSGATNPIQSLVSGLQVADWRPLLVRHCATRSAHRGWRLSPHDRTQFLALNVGFINPTPGAIVVVDDVLTTGCHFRAAKMVLRNKWPATRVIGLFLARTCPRSKRPCHQECTAL